ncbi:dehydrogenase [Candidatus Poribacteria bacterium]|jgi:predicted dehydrogenase|nr:dehydrogenase [Candidatus Poribacteria bacterium]MDP6598099.1 Gfo/Idh/MocA family oxidoreductase [Candidatus Poribacteria bacterium]MDP6750453.1 Gfo/Idh/MocA family oxidoreductase [Candidatus Poribacteria bacterium]MDP6960317.1 Gfo/Idh/MocA family oxidoreductase [Dehalococcoidia bacterium]
MAKIDVALIGAGGMANSVHYPSLADFDDVSLVGLCDLISSKRQATAETFGIEKIYTDYQQMIEETQPAAVYVLMPPQDLFRPAIYCLQRGIHVFIEKPPGLTTHQVREMANLAEENSCLTMVGFNRRFIPLLRHVKSIVEAEGPIIQCMSVFHKNSPDALYYQGQIDVLTCDAIHAVDALRWLGGSEVKAVASDINAFGAERENSFNALIKFTCGASGFLCTNWAVGGRIHIFEMHASGISAYVNPDLNGKAVIHDRSGVTEISTVEISNSDQNHIAYGFYAENRHFIDCIQQGQLPETHFSDAVKTMELVDMIYQNRIDG